MIQQCASKKKPTQLLVCFVFIDMLLLLSVILLLYVFTIYYEALYFTVGWLIIKGCINNVQLHLTKKCNNKKKKNNNNNFSRNTGSFSSQITWLMFLRLSPNVSRVKPRLSPGFSRDTRNHLQELFCVCLGSGVTSTNRGDD